MTKIGIFGVNYPFKELHIFTRFHNIHAIWDFRQKAISRIKLLWSSCYGSHHSMIAMIFVTCKWMIKFQKVWEAWKWMRTPPSCVPPPTHTLLSFFPSVMFSFMSARSDCTQETVTALSPASPTLEEQQWVSALHRPGASPDAAFALKQFLRISSKKYTNENRRLDAFLG